MKFFSLFPITKREPKKALIQRRYAAAAINRLSSDWVTSSTSADSELYRDLRTLRNRSRELCINNDYARRFLKRTSTNVIGSSGIRLQLRSQDTAPEINVGILRQFERWSKRGNCTVDGRLSWIDCQRMFLEAMARDGEVIVRLVEGFDNPCGFALQFIEADHLDENLNQPLASGNYVRMGIEFNKWNRPIRYHLLALHPGDNFKGYANEQKYNSISAGQIIHGFLIDRPSQSRGVPWMHSAMQRLRMLGAYEEAELVAARVGAAKMGFFVSSDGAGYMGAEDVLGNRHMEAEPGTFEQLPTGLDLRTFDPNHPNSSFADFEKSILRGIASGLDISYATLANDLENVNFSSIRHGSLEDRDTWRVLQTYVIEHFCDRVFASWLRMAITSGSVRLPIQDFDRYNRPIWRARGWAWVDPLKENHANQIAIAQKTRTRSQIAADQGNDIEEIFQQLVFEEELAKKYGLKVDDNQVSHINQPNQINDEAIDENESDD